MSFFRDPRRSLCLLAGAGGALVALSAATTAAAGFRDVWGMTAQQIRAESDASVCDALAGARRRNLDFAVVNAEVARRQLDCSGQVALLLGQCEPLSLIRKEVAPGQGVIFTVRNSSGHAVRFHVNYAGIASSPFDIPPNTTQRFGVRVPPGLGALSGLINRNDPDANTVMFFNCSATRGGW